MNALKLVIRKSANFEGVLWKLQFKKSLFMKVVEINFIKRLGLVFHSYHFDCSTDQKIEEHWPE